MTQIHKEYTRYSFNLATIILFQSLMRSWKKVMIQHFRRLSQAVQVEVIKLTNAFPMKESYW